MEEMRIKLRVLESKRAEEVEKLRALEGQVREVDDLKRGLGVMQSAPPHPTPFPDLARVH